MGNPLVAKGKLDRRVTIVTAASGGTDSWGQEMAGPPQRTTRWASIRPAPGTERFASGENAATAVMRFVFLWQADLVPPTAQLEHDGQTYDVKSVTEIGRREGLEVLAVAVVRSV